MNISTYFLKIIFRAATFLLIFLLPSLLFSQTKKFYTPQKKRILLILDASGSMKEMWGKESKFEISENLLIHVIDSIEKVNPNVEFGLRVFGHQYPKDQENCKDSKLEIPFAKRNFSSIKSLLEKIHPQGQTPLAYSLFEGLQDFPNDTLSTNAIILITDGIETCEGEPCAIANEMQKKRISLKPFIVGLGMNAESKKYFNCVGTFFDVSEKNMFNNTMNAVISQALNTTSAQINLLTSGGMPSVTNVSLTLYDHFTGKMRYDFIHTLDKHENPDTLYLDPIGSYDLVVHTLPSVEKKDIELAPGKHNIIAADVPQGTLDLQMENGKNNFSNIQCIVRKSGEQKILYVQDYNTSLKYLAGDYDLEILTLPRIEMYGVKIKEDQSTPVMLPVAGTLTYTPSQPGVASVFYFHDKRQVKVYDFYHVVGTESLNLQPGTYQLIFRPDKGKQTIQTQDVSFEIISSKTTAVKL